MPLPPKPPALDVPGWAAPSTSSTSEPTIPGALVLSSDSDFWELHEEVRTLGKGSFGEVRLVRIRSTGALVAVKIIAKSSTPAGECYGAVDARNEPKILMEVQRKFDSAPARIGGRRRQRLGMTPPPSLLQLQDALRAPAVDAAMPLPLVSLLSPAAGLRHHPRHRRTVSLGKDMDVAAGTRPQTLPGRRNTHKGKARPSAMSLWELQEALGEQGASGSGQEEAVASTAEPEATQQQQQQQQQQQRRRQQQQGVVSVGEDGGEGGGAPEEGEEEEGEGGSEGEDDSVRLLEVYDSPATLFMVMRAELGGDLESRSRLPSALLSPPQPSPSSLALSPRPKPSPLPHPQPAAPTLASGSPRYRAACVPKTRRACTRRPSYERSSRCKPKAIRTRRLAPVAPALTLTIRPHLPTTRPPSPGTPRGWYTATSSRVTCC